MSHNTRTSTSTQPRKQRLRTYTAPIHVRRRMLSAHLADDLMTEFKRRALPVRKGDIVKVLRGDFKGKSGEVLVIDRKRYLIEVEGVTVRTAKGTEVARPIHPSTVLITKLDLTDPKRREMIARKEGVTVKAPAGSPKTRAKKETPEKKETAAKEVKEGPQ